MSNINPNLIPTIQTGNLFSRFLSDENLSIRWLSSEDPVYFENFNRPLLDLRVNQLIMAKSLDNFSIKTGYLTNFPFINNPIVDNGTEEYDVPLALFHDFNASIPLRWYNPRLIRVDRISGTNTAAEGYSGVVRFIFGANRDSASGPLRAILYADYIIDSNLYYQPSRIRVPVGADVPGLVPVDPADADSIDGYIILKTSQLNEQNIPTDPDVRGFLDLMPVGTTLDVVDSHGLDDDNSISQSPIQHGTGILTADAFSLITQPPDAGLILDPTGSFYNADDLRIRNLGTPLDDNDAVTKAYVDDAVGLGNTLYLRQDGSTTFTGTEGPFNMGNNRIINLAPPVASGDAVNKQYVDTVSSSVIRRDGGVAWLSSGQPFDMSGVRITNVGTPTAGSDAATKSYVDSIEETFGTDYLRRDGSQPLLNNLIIDSSSIQLIMNGQGGSRASLLSYGPDYDFLDFDIYPRAQALGARYRFFRRCNYTGSKSVEFLRGNNTTQQSARIGVDGGDSFFQNHGGYLGIGTSTPEGILHVVSSSSDHIGFLFDRSGSDTRLSISMNPDGSVVDFNPINSVSQSFNLRFFRNLNVQGTKRITVLRGDDSTDTSVQIGADTTNSYFQVHGGNFGIGTFEPQTKLHLIGTGRIESENFSQLEFNRTSTSGNGRWAVGIDPDGIFCIRPRSASWSYDGQNGINIDRNSNLGIGTGSPSAKLHVAGSTIMDGNLNLRGNRITNVGTPSAAGDVVSRGYVDTHINELRVDRIPAGSVTAYAGNQIPDGWLLCDGRAVSRSTYSDLFNAIGTIYGNGNGTTTFNLPDMRGRTAVGAGNGPGLSNRSLASNGGSETHTLTVNEMPSHSHNIDRGLSGDPRASTRGSTPNIYSVTGGQLADSGKIKNTGGGDSHNNMQPFLALNYIIKA